MEHAFRGPGQGARPVRHPRPGAGSPRPSPRPSPTCAQPRRRSTATAGRWRRASRPWPRWCATTYGGRAETDLDRGGRRRRPRRPAQGACPGSATRRRGSSPPCVGKQLGVRPAGWQEAIGPYAEDGSYRSVADVVDETSLQKVARVQAGRQGGRQGRSGLDGRPDGPMARTGRTRRMAADARTQPGGTAAVACATCGAAPADDPALARLTWARGIENGQEVWTCDTCSRATCAASRASSTRPGGDAACDALDPEPGWGSDGGGRARSERLSRRSAAGDAAASRACAR